MSRVVSTPYIEWAKLSSPARFNLAASGVPHASLADLDVTLDDVEIAGPGGYGYGALVARIAAKHRVPESWVVTAAGTSMANHLAMAALVEPGDEVLVERPTYEPLLATAQYLGARVRRVDRSPDDGFQLDADAVARAITTDTRLVVMANLHNPSSAWSEEASLRRIGDRASTVGARVLVDEVYLDAIFDRAPASCVHLGPAFVSTSSLTKIYGLSGLRCGWILADEAMARRMWRLNDLFSNVPAHPAERLSVTAMDRLPHLLARARTLLDANRKQLAGFCGSRGDVEARVPAYGTTICLRPLRIGADTLAARLRDRYEVSVVPGRFFEQPEWIRVGLCADPAVTQEALARISDALDAAARA
jgi:hypothetical protein